MALRNILTKEQPGLYKKCRPVTKFDARLHQLLDDMAETLEKANGVGLAAPQVGVLRRAVLVLETNVPEGEPEQLIELINPEIIETSGEQDGPEGCLSVPGEYGLVKRPMNVKLRAQDRNGNCSRWRAPVSPPAASAMSWIIWRASFSPPSASGC